MAWLVAVITVLLLFIWLREAVRPSGGNRTADAEVHAGRARAWAAAAVLTPFALVALERRAAVARAAVLAVSVVPVDAARRRRRGRVQPVPRHSSRAGRAAADQRQRVPRALAGVRAPDGHLPRHRDHAREASLPGDPEPRLRQRRAAARRARLAEQRRVRGTHGAGGATEADRRSPRRRVAAHRHRRRPGSAARRRHHVVRRADAAHDDHPAGLRKRCSAP